MPRLELRHRRRYKKAEKCVAPRCSRSALGDDSRIQRRDCTASTRASSSANHERRRRPGGAAAGTFAACWRRSRTTSAPSPSSGPPPAPPAPPGLPPWADLHARIRAAMAKGPCPQGPRIHDGSHEIMPRGHEPPPPSSRPRAPRLRRRRGADARVGGRAPWRRRWRRRLLATADGRPCPAARLQ